MPQPASWIFVTYIPVIHNGYFQCLKKLLHDNPKAIGTILLIDTALFPEQRSLTKDLRALPTQLIQKQLSVLFPTLKIDVITPQNKDAWKNTLKSTSFLRLADDTKVDSKAVAKDIANDHHTTTTKLYMPDEQLNHQLVSLLELESIKDTITWLPIFLRWDPKLSRTRNDVHPAQTISKEKFDQSVMNTIREKQKNFNLDWWRQVYAGLVITQNGQPTLVLTNQNRHLPYDQQPYVDGEPRADFSSGQHIEMASSIHAESLLIATAAKQGISTHQAWLYVTTFPCPICAKLIAKTGISRLYYQDGYSLLNGQAILEQAGIELIQVI